MLDFLKLPKYVKVGYAGANFPEAIFPSIIGRPIIKYDEHGKDEFVKDIMIGDETYKGRSCLELSHPMENGVIKNWDDMCHLWEYTFSKKLGINDLKDHRILLTEPAMNPDHNREKMVEIMFERFHFDSVYIAIQAILTLYAQGIVIRDAFFTALGGRILMQWKGLQTGVVVDSGDGVTHIIPVYEGYPMSHATKRLNIAGRDITRYLINLLLQRGYAFNKTTDFEIVREIKEKLCYVGYVFSSSPTLRANGH